MKFKKFAAVASVGVAAVLSLSGCLRMEANVYVNADGQVYDVITVIAASKGAPASLSGLGMGDMTLGGEPAGELTLESFKQDTVEQNPEASEYCVFSESDSEFLATCETPLSELSVINPEGVTITSDGSLITVTQETEGSGANFESLAAMKMFGVSVTSKYHFPGVVESVSGAGASVNSSEPNVAVIDILATDGSPIVITASSGESSFSAVWLLLGSSVVIVLFGLAAFFLNSGKGRKSEPVADGDELVVADVEVVETAVVVDEGLPPEDKPASS